jgi:hypothetical protein
MWKFAPGQIELVSYFRKHLGPRFDSAGLRVQFHYNQEPGIHFKVKTSEEYRDAIMKGLLEGMALRFPDFPGTGSIWITEIMEDKVSSSWRAFYLAARLVIEQAYSLVELSSAQQIVGPEPPPSRFP